MNKNFLKRLPLILLVLTTFNTFNAYSRTVYKMKAKAFKMTLSYHKGSKDFMDYQSKSYLMLNEGFNKNELILFLNTKKSVNYRLAFLIDKKGSCHFLTLLLKSQKIENNQLRKASKRAYATNDYKVIGTVQLVGKSLLLLKSLSDKTPLLTFVLYKNYIPKNALMPGAKRPLITAILSGKKNIDAFIKTAVKYCKK